nr:hypothetical protein [uncultured Lichenicoccus sp.]
MSAWTLHIAGQSTGPSTQPARPRPVVCRSYAELLLQLRMEWHAAPFGVFEVEIPDSADPDEAKALRKRGCLVRYRRREGKDPAATRGETAFQ